MEKKTAFISILILILLSSNVTANTILVTSDLKIIKVTSDVCEQLRPVVSCNHKVYVNGLFLGAFPEGSNIQVPDNSNITIDLDDPINTNLQNLPETKTNYLIVIMGFLQSPLPWLVIIIFVWMILRHLKRLKR